VQHVGAAHAWVFIPVVPVFAVHLAAVLLHARLGLRVLAGGLWVMAGVWLPTRKNTTLEKTA
jgi:drug/metabolite transporter (DMT)-like permease